MTTKLSDDDKKKIVELIKLEQTGAAPPGFTVEQSGEKWKWSSMIEGQLRMATLGSKEEATAVAWLKFWETLIGWIPHGYTIAGDPAGHVWTYQAEGEEPLQSFPKASREEAQVEAWVDFKCKMLGLKRPPTKVATGDPRAIMSAFQQSAFELVTVETELRRLEARRDVLVAELRQLGVEFNDAMKRMAEGAQKG